MLFLRLLITVLLVAAAVAKPERAREALVVTPTDVESFDWQRDAGMVTRMKNQGLCGSCWAFAGTAVLETMCAKKTGILKAFSEQAVLECLRTSNICSAGNAYRLGQFLKGRSLPLDRNVPYLAYDNSSHSSTCGHPESASLRVVSIVEPQNSLHQVTEEAMRDYVAQHGPLVVSIAAQGRQFADYTGGLFLGCPPHVTENDLDHDVTIVGFGTSPAGVPYWRIKNSWSPSWGSGGYLLLPRGGNACGVGFFPLGYQV